MHKKISISLHPVYTALFHEAFGNSMTDRRKNSIYSKLKTKSHITQLNSWKNNRLIAQRLYYKIMAIHSRMFSISIQTNFRGYSIVEIQGPC